MHSQQNIKKKHKKYDSTLANQNVKTLYLSKKSRLVIRLNSKAHHNWGPSNLTTLQESKCHQ